MGLSSCLAPSVVRRAEQLRASGDQLGARQLLLESDASNVDALLALADLESELFPWHLERGFAALVAGENESALHSFEQALAIAPGQAEARRGESIARSRLHQRNAARALLETACAQQRWRAAFEAVSMLRPRDILGSPRGLGEPVDGDALFARIRERLFDRFDQEIEAADRAGDLDTLTARVLEASEALGATRAGEAFPDSRLEESVADWEALLDERRTALAYSREASAGLIGGDELRSWRQYRLARQNNPGDRAIALAENSLREGFNERALLALDMALAECDLSAARLALGWIDEAGDGWPAEVSVTRADVESWIVDGLVDRAREAESRGYAGQAMLAWFRARELIPHPDFDRRIDRLWTRIEAQSRVVVGSAGTLSVALPPGLLEVMIPPMTVEEAVEQVRVAESAGWVRTGVCRTPNPGHESDVRRWEDTLIATIDLRDEWLNMPPTRAALGERRLHFQAEELRRIGERLHRAGPTHERGVWRAQEVDLLKEHRRIRVQQTLLLRRDGQLIGEMSIEVEDCASGRLPEGETPSALTPLSGGEAAAERLRLRLEAECRRRVSFLIEDLRKAEVDRLEGSALERARAGDDVLALELLVAAWVQADPADPEAKARRAARIATWADLPPIPLSLDRP